MKEVKLGMGFILTEMEVQDREPNAERTACSVIEKVDLGESRITA